MDRYYTHIPRKEGMNKLTSAQLTQLSDFISGYSDPTVNAATSSTMDANANIESKNVATLSNELYKDYNIQLGRYLLSSRIKELYGEECALEFERQVKEHEIYVHDESHPFLPYCAAISLQPFLNHGMKYIGGESKAPQHLEAFCGSFVNLIFAVSSMLAGACATVEFLNAFDYFARKDYGNDYLLTHEHQIKNHLEHVVYAINQPAAARNYQSAFWNISIFDKNYADNILSNLIIDNTVAYNWESLDRLQRYFLSWFNKERTRALLTFPVVTAAMLTENGLVKDSSYKDLIATEFSEGNSFFVYLSNSVDSLSSCCRLQNKLNTFSYTLGGTGVSTGSAKVITLNINRLIQTHKCIGIEVQKVHKYLYAYRTLLDDMLKNKMLPIYDAGYIHLNKQYLTIGVNGVVEAAQYLGYDISYNPKYVAWLKEILCTIKQENENAKNNFPKGVMFNTEFVPAENLGVKNALWDKKAGLKTFRDTYNSYFYIVENDNINVLDKFKLYGSEITDYLDGGSALHLNLSEYLSKDAWLKLLDVASKVGCNYFTYNVPITICNKCGLIDKRNLNRCAKCGSEDVDKATRIIGYLKRISSFSKDRQIETKKRYYHIKL